ncbi:MAG: hypothetical protein ABIV39_08265 [Verrucomicrobiota bacterium]
MPWPFEDPQNCAVFVTRAVMRGEEPILLVTHDDGEDSWSFVGTSDGTLENCMIIALGEAVALDPTVLQLADLPIQWLAHRHFPNGAWIRKPNSDAI